MVLEPPFVLLDDARPGAGPARLYTRPRRVLTATAPDEIAALLHEAAAGQADAAGFLSYGAGVAFEPAAGAAARDADAPPLAWFGLFDGWAAVDDVAALLPDPAASWVGPPEPEPKREEYAAMFARAQALIAAGDLYQLNLTFRARVPFLGDPLALYARLRPHARAGWGAIVATGQHLLLSFSPELFVALDGTRLTCRPMKGTARRHDDPAADAGAARALREDAKQRAENLMIVDLMRNDLARVAVAGSVAVPALFDVEQYPSVHQLTSTVTATLAPGRGAADVLGALFPCGSITGAPKVRAMQAIAAIEQGSARGVYTGAIGRIDADGDAQFNVAIRTLTITPAGTASLGVGGGIVADSGLDEEWDEALAKADFVARAATMPDLIETIAFDPLEGLLLVDRHLARMKASAAALGFTFDRHAVRNELQAATFRLREGARVRLVLAASGAIAIEVSPPPTAPAAPLRVALVPLPVGTRDWRLCHKSSDRGFYDAARLRSGADEVVFVDPAGRLTEGSFTTLFVERDGALVTPRAGALLPGVLRAELLADGRAVEGELVAADLAGGFLLGNALRGLMRATLAVAQ
ncbi:aminodeoxychorismate synthase component I [Sphingomonas sp. BK235]|uniref:aminodeoxychorismate synthase component I n=1 Tax=Sphingomonas sp. BK235 TaxID=2512131 RepID=UPI0010505F0B|nr:aminodeoxychorismate synthase component I [Sphingomonas sp. BK235]TCP35849.1 para-aminobenzoate synthetase/4-amino-4-deoxychorismate lyase [Sphingomonas sp. BK235]